MRYFFAFIFLLLTTSVGFAAENSNHILSIFSSPELRISLGFILISTIYFFYKSDRFSIVHAAAYLYYSCLKATQNADILIPISLQDIALVLEDFDEFRPRIKFANKLAQQICSTIPNCVQ
ncbi:MULTISPECIES: hypothetical protein [unclassified Legionella]|uniref:hypothetical protein n=1 Tax=unclassified Legionella TaxID=2622702 RepID=UPI003AF8DBA9